jgi:hypothetical protein
MTHPEEFTDTDPRAMEVWLDILRQKPAGDRLAATLALADLALKMAEAGVRASHPHISNREVFLRRAARHLPRDLMVRAYGWDPEVDGDAR